MEATLEFPPLDTAAPTTALATKPAADIAPLSIKDTVLQQFRATEPGLIALAAKYARVAFDTSTTKGLDAAKAARLDLREQGRYAVQRAEKRIKADVNDLKATMAEEVARLVAIIEPVEAHVDGQIKAREEQLAAEKAERERIAAEAAAAAAAIEAERKAKHEAGIAKIRAYVGQASGKRAFQIANGIAYVEANVNIDPAAWEEYAAQAQAALDDTLGALRTLHADTLAREEAIAAAKAQAEENARVAAENARIAAELAEQRRAIEAQAATLRAQREAAEAQRLAEQKARDEASDKAIREGQRLSQLQVEMDRRAARAAAAMQDTNRTATDAGCAAMSAEYCRATGATPEQAAEAAAVASAPLLTFDTAVAAAVEAHRQPDTERLGSQQVLKAEPATADATDRETPATTSPRVGAMGVGQAADAAPVAEVPTLNLSAINDRLGCCSVTGAQVADLGVIGVKAPKGPGLLFTQGQFEQIVHGLMHRLQDMADRFGG